MFWLFVRGVPVLSAVNLLTELKFDGLFWCDTTKVHYSRIPFDCQNKKSVFGLSEVKPDIRPIRMYG